MATYIPTPKFLGGKNQFASNGHYYSVAALDSTHYVIVFYNAAIGQGTVVIASIASDNAITLGTPSTFTSSPDNVSGTPGVVGLDANTFVVTYRNGNSGTMKSFIGTTSGITITALGTQVSGTYMGTSVQYSTQCICKLDSTHFAYIYIANSGTTNGIVQVGSVSGTTITLGTLVQFSSSPVENDVISISTLDSTHFVIGYRTVTTTGQAIVGSVSGTTITLGTPVSFTTTTATNVVSTFSVDATHFGVVCNAKAVIGITSGTTISSYGTPVGSLNTASASSIDSTTFVLTDTSANAVIGTISGTDITFGTAKNFDAEGVEGDNKLCSVSVLSSTSFVVAWNRFTSGTGQSIVGSFNFFQPSFKVRQMRPALFKPGNSK